MDCSPPGSCVHEIFPGKNTGVGCHFLLQGIFPIQGIKPRSPALQADSLPSEPPGKPCSQGYLRFGPYPEKACLLHVVSATGSHWRASTAEPAHSEGWLLMPGTQMKLSGVEGAWLGLEFPPRGPLPVTSCAFLLPGSWVSKGRKQKMPEFFFFNLLEYSCFSMLCYFLLYNKVNHPHVYIYPLPRGLPTPPLWHPSRSS